MSQATRSLEFKVEDSGPVDGVTVDERRIDFTTRGRVWMFQKRLDPMDSDLIRIDRGKFLDYWNHQFTLEAVTGFYAALKNDGFWGV